MFEIEGRLIGAGRRCFVIAEAGVNHNGDLYMARGLVDAAAEAGADAVKFQAFSAGRLATAGAPLAAYQAANLGVSEGQSTMLRRLEMSPATLGELARHCRRRGLVFLCSAFDELDIGDLEALGVAAFKVPSGEAVNPRYLRRVARSGRPVLLSTGMCTMSEVRQAVSVLRESGDPPLALLHCVSLYPTPVALANLRGMEALRAEFDAPVGYSDHTQSVEVGVAAAALGATLLEKHLTLDRRLPGPDHAASLEPADLAAMVRSIREVEAALGSGRKEPSDEEMATAAAARKSVVAAARIPEGGRLTDELLTLKRPGTGIPAGRLDEVIGRRARVEIAADTLIRWEDLD